MTNFPEYSLIFEDDDSLSFKSVKPKQNPGCLAAIICIVVIVFFTSLFNIFGLIIGFVLSIVIFSKMGKEEKHYSINIIEKNGIKIISGDNLDDIAKFCEENSIKYQRSLSKKQSSRVFEYKLIAWILGGLLILFYISTLVRGV